jgi:UDP-N-acetylmuramoyl-L-alanyl-D-glutamate--2,6-diaminopimelate ligase
VRRVKLSQITAHLESTGVEVDLVGDPEISSSVDVHTVTHDSRRVEPGTLFACLPGEKVDGHDFAVAAVDAGAPALLVQRRLTNAQLASTPQLVVADTRRSLGPVSALIAGSPSSTLTTVGITGTNGKTTVTAMLTAIFEANDWSTGVIGTLHGPRTTPEAPELQTTLSGFVEAGNTAAVLEVSSHALALHRVDGTIFDAVVFTNLGHDHLDLHGTPEEYFRAKASLFTPTFAPLAVINVDDTHGRLLLDVAATMDGMRVVPYSVVDLEQVEVRATAIEYIWRNQLVHVPIGGDFNVSNSLAALETAVALGVSPSIAASALATLPTIPGRFESVSLADGTSPPFSVVVDYAHTPDGLTEVLNSARSVVAGGAEVIVVFGCGGDRDQAKRPAMGAAAGVGADRVIITSDNPRSEDPTAIINDIKQGVGEHYDDGVTSQPDRRRAIGEALQVARPGDIVIIAGKGHEQTQDLGTVVVAFDDRAIARSFLQDLQQQDLQQQESTDIS